MKNQLNIPSLLMLLVYLASWLLLHVAPREAGYVVLKKDCPRKEARAKLAAKAKKLVDTTQNYSASDNELPAEQKSELKVCPVTLALPPASSVWSKVIYLSQTDQVQNPDRSYVYHFSSREPDPPRFA